jgi:hypothetical protein
MTWFLIMFSLRMLSVQHASAVVQVVKFPSLQACDAARGIGSSDAGVATVCTNENNDVKGFLAAMNCQQSKVDKLPDGTEVARFSCAPEMVVPK